MNQISKAKQVELAAFVFARITRDAETIATALDISVRTVQRLIHNDDFLAELDRWEYKGELNFQVKPLRDRRKSPDYEKAKRLWFEMTDIPEHKRARAIEKHVKTPYNTLRYWTRDWRTKADVIPDSER